MAGVFLIPELSPMNRYRLGAITSLGRHPENNIEVPDRSVSKFHAQIQRNLDGDYLLQDLGSRNGTYVAGQRIDRRSLRDGDELILGTVRFRFRHDQPQIHHTSALRVPEIMGRNGPLTVLGSSVSNSGGRVALTNAEAAIEHSNSFDVSSDHFLPADQVRDIDVLKRDYEKLRVAHELNQSIQHDAPVDEILKLIARRSFDLISGDRCAILLTATDGVTLEPHVVMQRGGDEPKDALPLSQTVLDEALRHKKAVLSTDAITDGRFQASASIVALSIRSAMCVPIMSEGEVFGLMHVDSQKLSGAFSQKDLRLFTAIANQAGAALRNASLLQDLKAETERRARLGRLLSPNLVEEVVAGTIDMTQGGELRDVAVMFTDIRGFTSMSESMTASEVTDMLNEYFEVMIDVVFRLGGTLDKYIGDAVMALFGVPKDDPEACVMAVRCGIEMQRALRSLNRTRVARGEPPIGMGIGINYGSCVWGPLGSRKTMDYTVVGDTVNVASRLCSQAKAGQVIISESVRQQLGGLIAATELPPARVKGKTEPIQIYSVEGQTGELPQIPMR